MLEAVKLSSRTTVSSPDTIQMMFTSRESRKIRVELSGIGRRFIPPSRNWRSGNQPDRLCRVKKKYVSNTTGTTNGIPLVRHTPFKLITSLILSSPKRKGERIESNKEEGRRVVSWNVEEGEKYPGRWSICTGVSGVSNWKK